MNSHGESLTKMRWLPYVLFALATCIFFGSELFGESYFWNDFAEYVYPTRVFAASHISHFELPFWNPYSFSGAPFLADIQTAIFYPPYFLLDMIANCNPYPIELLQFVIISHFFIAQVSMYLLCRRLKVSLLGAMIAAIAYGFSSPLSLHTFHPMLVFHLAWFPLILRYFYEAITERKVSAAIIGGLLLGGTMLSGSPQMSLYIIFFLGCFILWFTVVSPVIKKMGSVATVRTIGLGVLSIVIALGIFCIQFFPAREFATLSERSEITLEKASAGSMQFKQLVTAAVPKAFGEESSPDQQQNGEYFLDKDQYYLYWDTAFFFGITTLFLGIFGFITNWHRRETKFLAAMGLFAFLFALGENGFLYRLFFQLPFFNSLRAPARMMFYVSFGFCLMAGFGFDSLVQKLGNKEAKEQLFKALALPLLLCLGIMIGLLVNIPQPLVETIHDHAIVGLMLVLFAFAVAFLLHRNTLKPMAAGLLFVALIFLDLLIANAGFSANSTNPIDTYHQYLPGHLRAMLTPKLPTDIFRIQARNGKLNGLERNQGMVDRVMMYEGYNPLLLLRRNPPTTSTKLSHDLLSVRYELAIDSAKDLVLFTQRPDYFPNAWMVYSTKQATEESVKQVMQDSISYKDVAVIEAPLHISLSNKPSASVAHTTTCKSYTDNAIAYNVNTSEAGLLCTSEIAYPAWKTYVDGKEQPTHRINYCLRGVEVPAGNHTIEMKYESASFAAGSIISIATLLLSLGAIGTIALKQKRVHRQQKTEPN